MFLQILFALVLTLTAIAGSTSANAQQGCTRNVLGQVICAAPDGGAAVNYFGQVVTGRGACTTNSFGTVVCPDHPSGGVPTNSFGQAKTGPGQCVRTSFGQVMCSSQPGGGAAVNSFGQAVCSGGCVPGR